MNDLPKLTETPGGLFVDGIAVGREVFARYKAARDRQLVRLRAAAPLRGSNRTGRDQAGTASLGLFDQQGGLF